MTSHPKFELKKAKNGIRSVKENAPKAEMEDMTAATAVA